MNKDENRDNRRSIIKGAAIYAIGNFGTKIISFLIVPLYTYYISPSDMGDYDILITTVAMFIPLITLRICDAAYRWILHGIEDVKKCISATYRILLLSISASAIICVVAYILISNKYILYFAGLLVFGRLLDSLQMLLRGLGNQKLFVISGILYTLIYVVINLVRIIILHQGIEAMVQSIILSEVITIVIIIFFEPQFRTRIINTDENKLLTKEMLRYSAPLVPSALSWWVMGASDRYVIRFILGSASTGIYSVANKFPTIINSLFTIFNYSWTDVALGNLREGRETSEYSSKLFRRLYELSFSFVFMLIPVTKIVTTTILAESYKSASVYIGFLYLGSVFQGFTAFISAGLLQGPRTDSIAKSSTIGAICNLVIDLLLMKYIGIHAASISTFLGFFVMWLIRIHDIKNISPVVIDKLHFFVYLIIAIILSSISIFTDTRIDLLLTILTALFFLIRNKRIICVFIEKIKHIGFN